MVLMTNMVCRLPLTTGSAFVKISGMLIEYIQALVWPCVVVFILLRYRRVIESLIPRLKLKLEFSGVSIEMSPDEIKRTVEESLGDRELTDGQWDWLRRVALKGRLAYNYKTDAKELRPLRDAGLIRVFPCGHFLGYGDKVGTDIEITTLGRLFAEGHKRLLTANIVRTAEEVGVLDGR